MLKEFDNSSKFCILSVSWDCLTKNCFQEREHKFRPSAFIKFMDELLEAAMPHKRLDKVLEKEPQQKKDRENEIMLV